LGKLCEKHGVNLIGDWQRHKHSRETDEVGRRPHETNRRACSAVSARCVGVFRQRVRLEMPDVDVSPRGAAALRAACKTRYELVKIARNPSAWASTSTMSVNQSDLARSLTPWWKIAREQCRRGPQRWPALLLASGMSGPSQTVLSRWCDEKHEWRVCSADLSR
jgi:hypothetical protein